MSFADLQKSGGGRPLQASAGGAGEDFGMVSKAISNTLFLISSNVQNLQRMALQIGTRADTSAFRHDLQALVEKTRAMSKETGARLKTLNTLAAAPDAATNSTRRMQTRKLSQEFSSVLHAFEQVQQLISQKSKQNVVHDRQSLHHVLEERAKISHADESSALLPSQQNQQKLIQLDNEIEYNESLIAEREEGIKQLEATIVEVNEIFRDLGAIVHDQGQMLDNIESNVVSMGNYVEQGIQDINKAAKHQRKARGKACCILFFFLVILAIVILAVLMSRR